MIELCGITDVGLVRKENQDAYGVRELECGLAVCVVCDGMGGAAGGKLASRIAVDTFLEELEKRLRPDMDAEAQKQASAEAVALANAAIRDTAGQSPQYSGMGTTLVSAVIREGEAVVSNVGDSRAYHISQDGIRRITKDHSLVERMVDRGDIPAEEARRHPNRNLITRALGPDVELECDGYVCPLQTGDFLLLCSDGLVNTAADQEMLFEVLHGDSLESSLEHLLAIAKRQGAPDNVTAVLARVL